ncbi:putative E3 ubiquitin-protein ligase HERC6 [Collichthys lucidus]|uniref:Putative E3 ubiquitin-protein ligase HERC6 n=1 Tax=Collichthys lucidus TaxID=240159 RepID=A0A4U5UFW0_COLLU|nr:putative E3 ubiquitin-protein ligase HERC6 [Collichthys lucidus]
MDRVFRRLLPGLCAPSSGFKFRVCLFIISCWCRGLRDNMFSWGEDSQRGFRLRHGALLGDGADGGDGVHYSDLGYDISDLAAGRSVLAFVKTNGNSFIIRTNQREDGTRVRGKQNLVKSKEKIQAVSCGDDTVTLLSERGSVLYVDVHTYTPQLLKVFCNKPVTHVSCGSRHSVALTKDGQVYTWGQNSRGQLGLETSGLDVKTPQHVRSVSAVPVVQIAAGGEQSFAVSFSGYRRTPTSVLCLNAKKSVHVSCGENHTAVLTMDGVVFTFGSGQHGQLGHNSFRDELRPRLVAELWGAKVIKIACGRHFQTSPKYPGLNLKLARAAFKKLAKRDDVWAEVEAALLELLPSLDEKLVGVETLRIFLLLNELLHVIQRNKQRQSTELAVMVAAAIRRLSEESLHVIGDWWCSLSPSTMVKHVKTWKQVLSEILSSETGHCNLRVQNLLVVLQYMYNFVMDLKSKKTAFDIYVDRTMSKHQVVKPWPYEFVSSDRFFELRLKRTSLLEGAFTQLAAAHHSDFKKPFVVYLDEDPAVTDVYKRDFFHHLFPELVSPESGMFMFNDSVTLPWFPSRATKEDETKFFLFGVLCGLALYNQCIVYLPFPLALFKKLLDVEPTLEDLKEFSGVGKKEFVDAYMNHILNTSIEGVFREFKRGFFEVCDQKQVKLFTPEELQGVMVGREIYDWAKLKRNTVYESYYASHPTIQMFWEVFDDLTEEQKKDFLLFLTGFRTVPILGMDQIKMKVRVAQIESSTHDQHRPKSLTCHSILYLPVYSNKEIMQDRLTEALIEDKAFRLNG